MKRIRMASTEQYLSRLQHDVAINDAIAAHRLFSYIVCDKRGKKIRVFAVNPSILYAQTSEVA